MMKLHLLLEALIRISQKSKTDFALSMNMTPSGLSKILAGNRLPPQKERKAFTKMAADYFAGAIYAPHCHLKFESIFPIIYDFHSLEELSSFLAYAIEYVLDQEFALAGNVDFSYTERGFYYIGQGPILTLLCVILSDYLFCDCDEPPELYSTLPLSGSNYSRILRRIVVTNAERIQHITLNLLVSGSCLEQTPTEDECNLFAWIFKLQKYFNLNLWSAADHHKQSFLLIKGHILLLLNNQPDAVPLFFPIRQKNYLAIFYNMFVSQDTKKISYTADEAIRFLDAHPQAVTRLLEGEIESVYNFIPVGYMLKQTTLEGLLPNRDLAEITTRLFHNILADPTNFWVSIAVIKRFLSTGKLIIPLQGIVEIPPEDRVSHLRQINDYLNEHHFDKIKILYGEQSNFAVFLLQDVVILYTVDDSLARERIHVFDRDKTYPLLKRFMLSESGSFLELSPDLWHAFQENLLNNSAFFIQ